jgi:hypothetical protein
VLVLILMAVHAAIRRDEDPQLAENAMTAADMMQAMRLYDRMRREELAGERGEAEPVPDVPPVPAMHPVPPVQPIAATERSDAPNVTPLSGRGRGEAS